MHKQDTIQCPECKNDIPLTKEEKEGDVIECPFCGIELEIMNIDDSGMIIYEMIEEEK